MEVRNINFTGLGRAMSDMDCADGELSVSHNLILDNGAMRPIWTPEDSMTLLSGEELVYIHRTSNYQHFITARDGSLYFFTDESSTRKAITTFPGRTEDLGLTSIGNTLVMTSIRGLEYILYKDGGYKPLGQKPPELDIRWRLGGDRGINMDGSTLTKITATGNTSETRFDSEVRQSVSDQVASVVNRVLAKDAEENKFTSTFFVRWAYRMYNGVYMASPPVLMPINMNPLALLIKNESGVSMVVPDGALTEFYLEVNRFRCDLEYYIPNYITKMTELMEWEDVVDGIEIYVTPGIPRYDQNGTAEGIVLNTGQKWGLSYTRVDNLYAKTWLAYGAVYMLEGMTKDDKTFAEDIQNAGVFYKLKSYKIDGLVPDGIVSLEEGALKNITTSTALSSETDEYRQHEYLYADGAMVYNGRLNLFGVKGQKYNFPAGAFTVFTNGVYNGTGDDYSKVYRYSIRFVIGTDGETLNVTNVTDVYEFYEPPMYLFYPDNNATKAIIERYDSETGIYEQAVVGLTNHPILQGCYWFGGTTELSFSETTDVLTEDGETRIADYQGKVYTSEVNNPFYFPLGGINTIGTGDVTGISSVTKALSQGQFGQFPLYVFSTDGIWAMEVGNDGLYSSVKPVSRDVCVNGKSITQTDNAVMFVTEKGVMMLDGSNVVCISDMMNGRSFDVSEVDKLNTVMENAGVPSALQGVQDFMDYARVARMAYDYANSRIVLYKEGDSFCYVYSMVSTTWATLGLSIDNAVTDYPNVYVQSGAGVKNLSTRIDYDGASKVNTLLVSRPVKLGDDGFKTVDELVVRGAMDRGEGAVLLWGSHDGQRYVLIKAVEGNRIYRTSGSGYRYFRIGVAGSMKVGETLTMATAGFRRKYGNRLR